MHSARWDHQHSLTGKKVAVVGTGASAIQFVPEIQPTVGHLTLLQRTPAWVLPSPDRPISDRERRVLARYPLLQKLWRFRIYLFHEAIGLAFRYPWLMKFLERIAIRYMKRKIPDPELLRKLTPTYRIGCKRILMSKKYYRALCQPNAEVVTEPIVDIEADAVVTADGRKHRVDTIILATGFQVSEMPFSRHVRGRDGKLLSERWAGSPQGYLGTTIPGFPNLFFLLGPNTGLGHNSVVLMIESQIEHVLGALRFMRKKNVATVEARPEAEARYNALIARRMKQTVWMTGGCSSWYLDVNGRNTTLWPSSVGAFRRRVEPFKPGDYLSG